MSTGPGQAAAVPDTPPRPDPAVAQPAGAVAGAPPRRWRWPRRLIGALITLCILAGLGVGGLAWRLAAAPVPAPWLAERIGRAAAPALGGGRLEVGGAALSWKGFSGDGDGGPPIDVRLRQLRLLDAAGVERGRIGDAGVTLSLVALLRGRLAPATIDLRDVMLRLERDADGTLGLGGIEAAGPNGSAPDTPSLRALLADLVQPDAAAAPNAPAAPVLATPAPTVVAALRRLRLSGGTIALVEGARPIAELAAMQLDLRRTGAGALSGGGTATLRLGGLAMPVRLTTLPAPAALRLRLDLAGLRPAALGALSPDLAPLAALDAEVAAEAEAELGLDARLGDWRFGLRAGPGVMAIAASRIPLAGLVLAASGDAASARLTEARLDLGAAALTARGTATLEPSGWHAGLDLTLSGLLDLPEAWPPALAPEARARALGALPTLRVQRGEFGVALAADRNLRGVRLLAGHVDVAADQLTVEVGTAGGPPLPGAARGEAVGARGQLATAGAEIAARLGPDRLDLDRLLLRLPSPRPGATGPVLTAGGGASLADGIWAGALDLDLAGVTFADLPRYWPEAVRRNERAWITTNVTAGEVRGARVRIEAAIPETLDGDAAEVTALKGLLEADGVAIHWLRPMPPVTGIAATAEFGLQEIVIRTRGGRQQPAEGGSVGLEARDGTIRFFELDTPPGQIDIRVGLGGALPEVLALLRHPRLKLFERRPLPLQATGGTAEARLTVAFPLLDKLPIEEVRIGATARIAEARLAKLLVGRDLTRGAFALTADTDSLRLVGTAALAELPFRLDLGMDFRAGPPAQVTERATVSARATTSALASLGLEVGDALAGSIALEARGERRRSGQGEVLLRGDLREARVDLAPLGWRKAAGAAGAAQATLRLTDEGVSALDGVRVDAPGLTLRGSADFGPGGRLERIELPEAAIGASRFAGEARRGRAADAPLTVRLRGPVLDLGAALASRTSSNPPAPGATASSAPPLALDLRLDRVLLGEGRVLHDVAATARTDARGLLREARASGAGAAQGGGFALTLLPEAAAGSEARVLRATAEDFGLLLRAAGIGSVEGGRLTLDARWEELRPGAPLAGTAQLDGFALREAPAAARLLQALSVYGIAEALQGGSGLVFSRAIAPFALTPDALRLRDARAYSASLGLTLEGEVRRDRETLDLGGTIVPSYLLNAALGNLPLVGRLFSPERGGGLFAATYRVQGPIDHPAITVNPLAALAPGLLRRLFGGLERPGGR